MSYDLGELDRRLANIVRIGTIAALDEVNALVQVKLDGTTTTAWLPWITARAGNTKTWSAPRVGEQVVILSQSGEIAQGVVLPALYQTAFGAPANTKDKETAVYPDGSSVEYNSATNTLTVNVAAAGNVVVNCQHATINAQTDTTINSPATKITGTLEVGGAVTMKSTLEVDQAATMKTTAVVMGVASVGGLASATPGGAVSATGGMNMTGGNITVTGGDVKADGVGLKSHSHSDPQGGTVGPAAG